MVYEKVVRLQSVNADLLAALGKAVKLINILGASSLELAAKYGPDFELPTTKEMMEMRDECEAAIKRAKEGTT